MKLNRDPNNPCHYLNHNNVVLSDSYDQGKGDSLGRTAVSSVIYDEDREDLVNGVMGFFTYAKTSPRKGLQLYVARYPSSSGDVGFYLRGNSRDHVIMALSCMKELGEHEFIRLFLTDRAKRPCIDHGYTLSQKILFKAMYSDFWSWVYALTQAPLLLAYVPYNFILRLLSGTRKTWDNPKHFSYTYKKPLYRFQSVIHKAVLPTFASLYTTYGIRALENKTAKSLLLSIMRLHFEKTNYVAQALCLKRIKAPDIYHPSCSYRWSTRLDRACDRDMTPHNHSASENVELAALKHYTR